MGDFLTRLAERTLGVAPVVQPMIASVFAPEPAGNLPGLEQDGEVPVSSSDLDRAKLPPAVQTPPAWDTPKEIPQDTAISEREEQGANIRITPPHPSGTSDVSPEFHHPARSGPSERRITSGQEDQSTAALTAPNPPRRIPDAAGPDLFEGKVMHRREDQRNSSSAVPESRPGPSHPGESDSLERGVMTGEEDQRGSSRPTAGYPQTPPETLHRAKPDPTPPGALPTSQDVLPKNLPLGPPSAEDESDQAVSRPVRTLVDYGQDETLPPPRPTPGTQTSLDASEDTLGSKATLDPLEPPDAIPPDVPRIVHPQLNAPHVERGSQEPRAVGPEPSEPAIRVSIGRIEVRAITPPPPTPPAQRTTPVRPGPALSLDDYLKQRNGGQR